MADVYSRVLDDICGWYCDGWWEVVVSVAEKWWRRCLRLGETRIEEQIQVRIRLRAE